MDNVRVRKAVPKDVGSIVALVNAEANASLKAAERGEISGPTVLQVTHADISARVAKGFSVVAEEVGTGKLVGYIGAIPMKSGDVELRSGVVMDAYRGNGISTEQRKLLIDLIRAQKPEAEIWSITHPLSQARGILEKLGFDTISDPGHIPKELHEEDPIRLDKGDKAYVLKPVARIE